MYVQPSVKTLYSLHTVPTSLRPILWPALLYLVLISISVLVCHPRVRYRAGSSSITGPMRLWSAAGRHSGHLTTIQDASRASHKTHFFYSVQLWHIVEILALCRAVSYLRAVYNIKRGLHTNPGLSPIQSTFSNSQQEALTQCNITIFTSTFKCNITSPTSNNKLTCTQKAEIPLENG